MGARQMRLESDPIYGRRRAVHIISRRDDDRSHQKRRERLPRKFDRGVGPAPRPAVGRRGVEKKDGARGPDHGRREVFFESAGPEAGGRLGKRRQNEKMISPSKEMPKHNVLVTG